MTAAKLTLPHFGQMTHQGPKFVFPIGASRHSVPVSKEWPECGPEQALRADAAPDRIGRASDELAVIKDGHHQLND